MKMTLVKSKHTLLFLLASTPQIKMLYQSNFSFHIFCDQVPILRLSGQHPSNLSCLFFGSAGSHTSKPSLVKPKHFWGKLFVAEHFWELNSEFFVLVPSEQSIEIFYLRRIGSSCLTLSALQLTGASHYKSTKYENAGSKSHIG